MTSETLTLVDRDRSAGSIAPERALETLVALPGDVPAPLILFAHGFAGHPRKFTRLFATWSAAGFAIAAPRFPLTADDAVGGPTFDDVPNQPADLSFVLDEVLDRYAGRVDPGAVAFVGFSMGAVTVLASGFERLRRHPRARAVVAIAGGLAIDGDYDFGGPPLLLLNLRADPIVPYERAREVFDAAAEGTVLITVDSATHHLGIEDEPLSAVSAVVDIATTAFLDLTLRGDASASARLDALAAGPAVVVERQARSTT